MSKTFAFISENNGEVSHTMVVSNVMNMQSGILYGDHIAIDITEDRENEKLYLTDKYFVGQWVKQSEIENDPENPPLFQGQWQAKLAKPNEFYDWTLDNGWVFNQENFYSRLRKDRDFLLAKSDWTQMPDSPLSPTVKGWWASYRQQLRDLPANLEGITSLDQVQWPTEP